MKGVEGGILLLRTGIVGSEPTNGAEGETILLLRTGMVASEPMKGIEGGTILDLSS